MTEPFNFFYFLVYKLPVSVLISGSVKDFSQNGLQGLA